MKKVQRLSKSQENLEESRVHQNGGNGRNDNRVKIYVLKDPRNMQIRYLGKTIKPLGTRLSEHLNDKKDSYKTRWIRQLKEFNLQPIIELIDEVSNKEWIFWEKFWITILRLLNFDLVNTTDGGNGTNGYIPPKNVVEKRIKHLRKKIKIYSINGELLHIGDSIAEASRITGVHKSHISEIAKGKVKTAKDKYVFRYIEDRFDKYSIKWNSTKRILQCDLNGNPIRKWNSIIEAANSFGIKAPNISRVLRGERRTCRGFTWKYYR